LNPRDGIGLDFELCIEGKMVVKMVYMLLGVTWPLMFGALPLVVSSNNLVMFLMIKSSM
jgi:hypothetical protein